jgi:hypothetical protein
VSQSHQQKKYEYKELKEWWKTHKISKVKEENDMVPISYDPKTSWAMVTEAIIAPKGLEGRKMWEELRNYNKG